MDSIQQRGIKIHFSFPWLDYFDPKIVAKTIENIKRELENILLKASKKFEGFEDAIRILLIERHIDISLTANYLKDILIELTCPKNIDQIWFSELEWDTNDCQYYSYCRWL